MQINLSCGRCVVWCSIDRNIQSCSTIFFHACRIICCRTMYISIYLGYKNSVICLLKYDTWPGLHGIPHTILSQIINAYAKILMEARANGLFSTDVANKLRWTSLVFDSMLLVITNLVNFLHNFNIAKSLLNLHCRKPFDKAALILFHLLAASPSTDISCSQFSTNKILQIG